MGALILKIGMEIISSASSLSDSLPVSPSHVSSSVRHEIQSRRWNHYQVCGADLT